MERVWTFELGRVLVALDLEQERGYQYDGDDPDGETQAKLDCGDYIAFTSRVSVAVDGEELGEDWLSGSVYSIGEVSDFWTAHRTSNEEHRNTLAARAQRICYGHYFPGMVHEAIQRTRVMLTERAKAA